MRYRLLLAALPLLVMAGYAWSQGSQTQTKNLNGPVVVSGNLTATKYCINSSCSLYIAFDGISAINLIGQVNTSSGVHTAGTVTSDMYVDVGYALRNSTTTSICSNNTNGVCVDDSAGLSVADGSGNTAITINTTGLTYSGATQRRVMRWQASTNADTDFATLGQNVFGMAAATAVNGGGTCTPAADTTDDAYLFVKFPTDNGGAGHACGRNSAFTISRATFLPSFNAVVRTDPAAVTSQTVFVGMAASSLDQVTTLAGANTIKGCWFRYDTGLSDTAWQACSSDGTTASCTTTTVSVTAATTYRLGIDNTLSGTCDFYVNGVLKVTKKNEINTTNTALGIEATITARASAVRALSVSKVILEEN